MIGAVARAEDADGVDIDRLVVDPAVHRRGAGRKLVQAVLFRAGHRRATVSTGRANLPGCPHARCIGGWDSSS
ncbi:GNAT family N-acetyltransferase [Janibacter indicus]|uniref:GNAT family N-acetyltransferase n=1 Tax=Janibacter indicus TaxID=857417 RepID=UPI003AACD110